MTTARPNVLLITTDQHRYDALGMNRGAAGGAGLRTPHLDALAARGTSFSHGYVQNPVCVPSRACLMTGRYVHQHGVAYMENEIGRTPGLPPWETTLPERLRAHGYATAAYGKIHMLPPRGFDETALTLGKGARWTVARGSPLGPSQLGPVYAAWLEGKRPGAYESIYAQRRRPEYRDRATAIVNTLAVDEYVDYWIGENTWRHLERPETGTPGRPFFLWCGFCGPHPPYDPPEPYASLYRPADVPLPPLFHARRRNVPGEAPPGRFDREDGEALARMITAYYWGMVSFIDEMVGRILEVLDRRGLWERTLVIFTADHGDLLGDYGRLGKGSFEEPVTRVPLVVVPPGSRPGAAPCRWDGLVEHIDLVPTVLDYAGLAQPAELPGMSLRPALEEGSSASAGKPAILCEYVSNDRTLRQKCLRTQGYKYVFSGADRPAELYDLEKDPQELVDLAGEPSHRHEVARHAALLLDRLMHTEQTPWQGGGAATPQVDHFGRPYAAPTA